MNLIFKAILVILTLNMSASLLRAQEYFTLETNNIAVKIDQKKWGDS